MWVVEKIAAAFAVLEASTAPVAAKTFPSALYSLSPFSVPSYWATIARAAHALLSRPAISAISTWSATGQVLLPWRQLLTACLDAPSSLASL